MSKHNRVNVRLDRSASVLGMMKWFAGQGIRVLPIHGIIEGQCACGDADCSSPGKHPISSLVRNGVKGATTDLKVIRRWHRTHSDMNYAVATEGLAVIDCDSKEALRKFRSGYHPPPTFTVKTARGFHFYFRGEMPARNAAMTKLDVKSGPGSYVVGPGSIHASGATYALWEDEQFADLPDNIATITERWDESSKQKGADVPTDHADNITKGRRDNALASIAGGIRRQGYGEGMIMSVLQAVNRDHCSPPMLENDLVRISRSVVRYAPEHEDLFEVLSNVTPRKVRFLWEPYLIHGAVNLWEGDPDVGKTFVLCALAAALSSGTPLPGQGKVRAKNVLFLSAEDDAETTLVPRMIRMGADLSRIWTFTKFVRLDEDVIQLIEQHIEKHEVRVIILDPLLAYMQGGIDMNKANETRPFMARLAELAKAQGVTIIALRHLNKSPKDKAIFRGLGSVDITAAARSAVMLGRHPEDPHLRILTHSKHNLSECGVSLLYALEGHDRAKGLVPKLVWRGESELTADDLASKPNSPGRPDDASREAEMFLQRMLAGGPKKVKDIMRDAERRSIASRTLRTVRQKMGIIKKGQMWEMAKTSH